VVQTTMYAWNNMHLPPLILSDAQADRIVTEISQLIVEFLSQE